MSAPDFPLCPIFGSGQLCCRDQCAFWDKKGYYDGYKWIEGACRIIKLMKKASEMMDDIARIREELEGKQNGY